MVFDTFGRILYDSSAINLVDSGWNKISLKATLQSPSRLISLKKFFKLAKVFYGKMLMEGDEAKCMVNSFMPHERFAITSNFH